MDRRKTILSFIKSSTFIAMTIYLIVVSIVLIMNDKGAIELWINERHHPFFDQFFKYWTYLGDGRLYAVLGIIFLCYRYSWLLLTLAVILIQTLLIQIPKRIIFDDLRPSLYFEGMNLHFVEGVKIYGYNAFPSGHTATGFAIFALLFFLFQKATKWHLFFGIAAGLVGLSRVYLMLHFFEDTLMGGILGVMSVLIAYYFFSFLLEKPKLQKGLLNK
ncbi:phosphatase PAP2 family protein [Peijinzhouia sedimentorum]